MNLQAKFSKKNLQVKMIQKQFTVKITKHNRTLIDVFLQKLNVIFHKPGL